MSEDKTNFKFFRSKLKVENMVEPEIKHYHGNDGSDDSSDEEMGKFFFN